MIEMMISIVAMAIVSVALVFYSNRKHIHSH